jgi:hypothetical protein
MLLHKEKAMKLSSELVFWGIAVLAITWFSACPTPVAAQGSQGQNAVYNSSGSCCAGSSGFIDASMFVGNGTNESPNICGAIYGILSGQFYNYPSAGAVIDARGISGTTALTCSSSTSPWFTQSGGYVSKPSTILLPAGTIQIPYSWVLPNGTRLVGEGTTNPALNLSNNQLQTTILALSGLSSGPMIQFGDSNCPGSSPTCTGISIENLTLVGNNQALTGIQNQYSQDRSYASHVTLYHVLGPGLVVSGNAQNSGPYSNINYDTGGAGLTGSVCAEVNGLSATRGIHGLSCVSSPDSQTAVFLDSSNNTLEDVRIMGFYDGVLVGSKAPAHSNVLLNIVGDTTTQQLPPVHVIHISSSNSVTDLSITGASNVLGGNSMNGEYSIYDEVTSTHLFDQYVAMYVLGESKSNGYSLYSTSPNAVNWSVGTNAPLTSNTCVTGSLYSCIGAAPACNNTLGISTALWGCISQTWNSIK